MIGRDHVWETLLVFADVEQGACATMAAPQRATAATELLPICAAAAAVAASVLFLCRHDVS